MPSTISHGAPWTEEETQKLLSLREAFSYLNWKEFYMLDCFPGRTESAIAAKWQSVRRRRARLRVTDSDNEENNTNNTEAETNANVEGDDQDDEHEGDLSSRRAGGRTHSSQKGESYQPAKSGRRGSDSEDMSFDPPTRLYKGTNMVTCEIQPSRARQRDSLILIFRLPAYELAQIIGKTGGLVRRRRYESTSSESPEQPLAFQRKFAKTYLQDRERRYMALCDRISAVEAHQLEECLEGSTLSSSQVSRLEGYPGEPLAHSLPAVTTEIRESMDNEPESPSETPLLRPELPEEAAQRPGKHTVGDLIEWYCSIQAARHSRCQDKIKELKAQNYVLQGRLAELERRAAKAKSSFESAREFLEQPKMFLISEIKRLYLFLDTLDTSEFGRCPDGGSISSQDLEEDDLSES
ncbi:hypothetical protein BJX64DRAFT_288395 [Aspergillus heterothallicus]